MVVNSICSSFLGYFHSVIPKTRKERAWVGVAAISSLLLSNGVGLALGCGYLAYKSIVPVKRGYSPEIPEGPITPTDLASIQSRKNVIAVLKVKNIETNFWETAFITAEKGEWGRERFELFNLQGELLGYAETASLRFADADFESSWGSNPPSRYVGYGADSTPSNKILLESLHTKEDDIQDRYKYSGYQLVRVIRNRFRDQFGDRMILEAGYNSHAFYYKLGFRSVNSEMNAKIETAILNAKGKEPKTSGLGTVLMHLP